jgi:hypothetical protein
MIITFIMFLLKQSTLSGVIFLFVPLVLSLLCVYYIRMLCRNVCVVSNNVVSNECHVLLSTITVAFTFIYGQISNVFIMKYMYISLRLQFYDISLRHASISMYISHMLFLEPLRTANDQHS